MKRQFAKVVMIIMQFIFYFVVNELFDVPDRIMYNTFFIYLALNLTKNMYSFKTILIWEELRKLLLVHAEYLIIMLINDLAFWGVKYIPVHLFVGLTFTFFNIFIIRFTRTVFRKNLEKSLLIIGIGNTAKQITKIIEDNNTFTMYNLLGYVSANSIAGVEQELKVESEKVIGKYEELDKILEENKVNEVLIALPLADNEQMEEIINKLDGKVDKIKFIPRLNEIYTLNSTVEDYDGMMVISTYNGMNKKRYRILKRCMDIIAGTAGCMVLGILYLIFAPKIKKDGGKAIFTQNRIGQDVK
ncbi:MAG: sugar transferase, partial [Candidatus Fusobacterium pullicola]|nr:sugar transferase [Candidatus Fusobacterium pullicola]